MCSICAHAPSLHKLFYAIRIDERNVFSAFALTVHHAWALQLIRRYISQLLDTRNYFPWMYLFSFLHSVTLLWSVVKLLSNRFWSHWQREYQWETKYLDSSEQLYCCQLPCYSVHPNFNVLCQLCDIPSSSSTSDIRVRLARLPHESICFSKIQDQSVCFLLCCKRKVFSLSCPLYMAMWRWQKKIEWVLLRLSGEDVNCTCRIPTTRRDRHEVVDLPPEDDCSGSGPSLSAPPWVPRRRMNTASQSLPAGRPRGPHTAAGNSYAIKMIKHSR